MTEAVLIITGIILLAAAICEKNMRSRLARQLEERICGCGEYEAAVLDVHTEKIRAAGGRQRKVKTIILQFRLEEQHKTVVNRCTERFFGTYGRGGSVRLYFREQMPVDFSMIKGDNVYERLIGLMMKLKIPCIAAGVICIIAGIATIFM